jgi:hypothetical protein
MNLNRRNLILGAGATTLALVGGAGAWRVTRFPEAALKPWALDPTPPADVRLDAFRHAILAPNPHNRQPWLIRLDGADRATISCDLDRLLPDTDPFNRQILIGFGTFLELARIAAAERGVRMEMVTFPEGEPQPLLDARPIARLRFVPDAGVARDPLFAAITKRHTNRQLYEIARPVPDAIASQIADGGHSADPKLVSAVRAVAMSAMAIEIKTPHTFKESIDLMRIGANEVDTNPDGIAMIGPKMKTLKLVGALDRAALADPASTAFKTGLDMQTEICGSIPGLMWIITPGNNRADQLEAGRRYVRAHLRAATQGVAMHPLSQCLQEFPEMAENFARIHQILGASGTQRVQMLARMGYAEPVGPAPRWPLETHIRT